MTATQASPGRCHVFTGLTSPVHEVVGKAPRHVPCTLVLQLVHGPGPDALDYQQLPGGLVHRKGDGPPPYAHGT
jgi:hypothetical protein